MKNKRNCIAVTGGVTGGHILPLIAVLEEVRKEWHGEIVWIGSSSGMEKRLIKSIKVEYRSIPTGKLRRYISVKNIFDIGKIISGIIVSYFILHKKKPKLLFSKGGYVSVPPVLAARLMKIPIFTHESDLDPGLATKINARFAEKIFISFSETAGYFKRAIRSKVVVTGNPVRNIILNGNAAKGREILECVNGRNILFILGGSQGAHRINELIDEIKEKLSQKYCVVHQTGFKDFKQSNLENYIPVKYLNDELADILAASSLVLCRAGANTLWELAASRKASILIPLPRTSSRGDQIRNAEIFRQAGASLVLKEENLNADTLLEIITKLLDNREQLSIMGENAGKLFNRDSSRKIARMIIDTVFDNEEY